MPRQALAPARSTGAEPRPRTHPPPPLCLLLQLRLYGSHSIEAKNSVRRMERKMEKLKEKLDPISVKLTAGYEMRCYWFEIFECLRKIVLIGVPILLEAGSTEQVRA